MFSKIGGENMSVLDWFRPTYLSWAEYVEKVEFMDEFNFQQETRKENIRNL